MEDGYTHQQLIYGLKHIKINLEKMEKLTLEQALNNIRIILDLHVADKKTHMTLDESFEIVKKECLKLNISEK